MIGLQRFTDYHIILISCNRESDRLFSVECATLNKPLDIKKWHSLNFINIGEVLPFLCETVGKGDATI
jgi:hypothetical protein